MTRFIIHFTAIDPDKWAKLVSTLTLNARTDIAAIADFCQQEAAVFAQQD